jgi:hypothetical protein
MANHQGQVRCRTLSYIPCWEAIAHLGVILLLLLTTFDAFAPIRPTLAAPASLCDLHSIAPRSGWNFSVTERSSGEPVTPLFCIGVAAAGQYAAAPPSASGFSIRLIVFVYPSTSAAISAWSALNNSPYFNLGTEAEVFKQFPQHELWNPAVLGEQRDGYILPHFPAAPDQYVRIFFRRGPAIAQLVVLGVIGHITTSAPINYARVIDQRLVHLKYYQQHYSQTTPAPEPGTQWTIRRSGVVTWLTGITCPSVRVCIVVGTNGTVLTSNDGGNTWNQRLSGTKDDLFAIACADSSLCIAVGDFGTILTTSDQGRTWHLHSIPPATEFAAITCPRRTLCLATGTYGMLASTDQGRTWHPRTATPTGTINSMTCLPALCLAVGNDGTILTDSGTGRLWKDRVSGTIHELDSVVCPTTHICVTIDASGNLVRSIDGGVHWTTHALGFGAVIYHLGCATASMCIAVGERGTFLVSTNAGLTWKRQGDYGSIWLDGVACPRATACLVVGSDGIILAGRP